MADTVKQIQESPPTPDSPPTSPDPREKNHTLLEKFKNKILEIRDSNPKESGAHLKAYTVMKGKKLGNSSSIGSIPGVEIGDKFEYRAELVMVGLHGKLKNGIDHAFMEDGKAYTTCIVAKVGHRDRMTPNNLEYQGEGGSSRMMNGRRVVKNQEMKSGNLALKNSQESQKPVRVVRGVQQVGAGKKGDYVYVYDGLYRVSSWREEAEEMGLRVFYFRLEKLPGQDTIDWKNQYKRE